MYGINFIYYKFIILYCQCINKLNIHYILNYIGNRDILMFSYILNILVDIIVKFLIQLIDNTWIEFQIDNKFI